MADVYLHGTEVIQDTSGIRPVALNPSAVIGIIGTADSADPSVFPLDTPVLVDSNPHLAASLDLLGTGLGTLPGAMRQIYAEGGAAVVVVRVNDDPLPANVMTNIIGSAANGTGMNALLHARTLLGVAPKTLIAPGYTSQRPNNLANPVIGALLPIATRLRGRIYGDMPPLLADAQAWRTDWGDRRVIGFYPSCEVWSPQANAYVTAPQSPSQAGLTSQVHNTLGYWWSSSNQELLGVGGVSQPVDWQMDDPNCLANILNLGKINTIVNLGSASAMGGWRRWGNATCSADPLWTFEAVGNAADEIYEAIEQTYLWMVDRPFSAQLCLDGARGVNAFFAANKKQGAMIGGKCWIDPGLNSAQQLQAGILSFSFDAEFPAPMEHIRFYAQRNGNYYTNEIATLTSLAA